MFQTSQTLGSFKRLFLVERPLYKSEIIVLTNRLRGGDRLLRRRGGGLRDLLCICCCRSRSFLILCVLVSGLLSSSTRPLLPPAIGSRLAFPSSSFFALFCSISLTSWPIFFSSNMSKSSSSSGPWSLSSSSLLLLLFFFFFFSFLCFFLSFLVFSI